MRILNVEEFKDRVGDDEVAVALLRQAIHFIPRQVEALRSAVAAKDSAVASGMAHTIKGACLTLGAEVLASAAADMEGMAEAMDWQAADELMEKIDSGVRDLLAAV